MESREARCTGWPAQNSRAPGTDRRRVPRSVSACASDWHAVERRREQGRTAHPRSFRSHVGYGLPCASKDQDDKDVTDADFANYNVVLFGDPGSNKWIAKMLPKLPLKWTKDTITVGGNTFPAAENLPLLGYPNPLHPSHYVVLNTGLTISDNDYKATMRCRVFGDMTVLKIKDPTEPPEIAWGGLFDESWQLPK